MGKCKLRNARPKALFGEAAAIMTAAGLQTAATLTSAGLQAKASTDAAKKQADAIKQQAKQQSAALAKQDENNKKLQERSIELTKEQNEQNRDLQREIQLNLQLLTGQQNQAARNEANKIVVRNGGHIRQKLRSSFPLQGNNIPFKVTDGGGVLPVGQTPEGYDLYEIIGNDHEHYHKTKGGKYKSGVGFKTINPDTGKEVIVEGEGNEKSPLGELVLATPNDLLFIPKHSVNGFNAAEAVLAGMHPIEAFNINEYNKAIKGINSEGKKQNKRKLRTIGGIASSPYNIPDIANVPDFSIDTITPTSTGVAYIMQHNAESNPNNMNYGSTPKYNVAKYGCNIRKKAKNGYYLSAAGLNTLGNIGGALISNIGNNKALRYITDANSEAANILANAYKNLQGIDTSLIRREDFAAPHAMAAVQAPIVNTNTQRTLANRSLLRRQEAINRNSLSAAAGQNRQASAEIDYNDIINQVENEANKERQAIIQGNMERITQVANENANRDAKANSNYYGNYLDALEYNADIANQRILGAADAKASALTNNASAQANTTQANAAGWSNAITNSAGSWGNAFNTIAENNFREKALALTADKDVYEQYQNRLNKEYLNRKSVRRKLAKATLNSMRNNSQNYIRTSPASNPYDWSIGYTSPTSTNTRINIDPRTLLPRG